MTNINGDSMRVWRVPTVLIGLILVLAGCGINAPSETTHDGLVLTSTQSMDAVYMKPDRDLSAYSRFKVSDCSVAFRKNWQRDQNLASRSVTRRVTDEDVNDIKQRLSEMCREIFVEELEKDDGYEVVEEAAGDVLELRPAIIDLDINAPDIMSPGFDRSYTTSFGSMDLRLEIHDSVTGEILGRIIDEYRDPDKGYLEWTNSVTNTADARRVLRRWSRAFRDMADEALPRQ